jgi:hypothetical protein
VEAAGGGRVLDGGDVGDPVIDTAFHLQGWLCAGVEQLDAHRFGHRLRRRAVIAGVAVWRFRLARARTPITRSPQRPTD